MSTISKLFPELDRHALRHLLRNNQRVESGDPVFADPLECLLEIGVITTREHTYVRCAYPDDYDYQERHDLACEGVVEIDPAEDEYYCPVSGDPIGDIERKTRFVEYEITLSPDGIERYLDQALGCLEAVDAVEKVGPAAFQVQVKERPLLSVVVADYAGVRRRSAGLFFAEPTLYVIASPINDPLKTVLDELQYMQMAEILSSSASVVQERLRVAAIPIPGRTSLLETEARFDAMIVRYGKRAWQFFEQQFVPALMLHATQNPALVQGYLETLKRLSGTIFGEYYVPIGGAGLPDLRMIDKFELMNRVFGGKATGDAKCYPSSTLSYHDVVTVNYQLDADPTGAETALIFVSGDDVASTAWNAVMQLKQQHGAWKVIILTKYLLLELISALEATHLLEM
ncbi:MAG: hypothetical protein JXB30_05105 [Anaerolineae bacterium]|nr:hypothetical protein [Anaerolineae bacterium]